MSTEPSASTPASQPRFFFLYRTSFRAFLAAAAACGIAGAAYFFYERAVSIDIVALELAGTPVRAAPFRDRIDALEATLPPDVLLFLGYGLAIVSVSFIGSRIFITEMARRIGVAAAVAGAAAAAFDAVEDFALWRALEYKLGEAAYWPLRIAAAAATAKFALLFFSAPVAILASLSIFKRSFSRLFQRSDEQLESHVWLPSPISRPPRRWPQGSSAVVAADKWNDKASLSKAAGHRYARMTPKKRPPASVAFCVSGGGIRSGCVAMGALQSLRDELLKADYLISVSGGGYVTGAIQLALQGDPPSESSIAQPKDVYMPGTPEEGHTRRHGKYIADNAKEWGVALWTLLRGLLASLTLLSATVITIGLVLSQISDVITLVRIEGLSDYFVGLGPEKAPLYPSPTTEIAWALFGALIALAASWLLVVVALDSRRWPLLRKRGLVAARAFMYLVALLALVLFVIPGLAYAATYLTWLARRVAGGAPWAAGGAVGTLALTYFGALATILWRHREHVDKVKKFFGGSKKNGKENVSRVVPGGFGQKVIVWVVLTILSLGGLLLLGITIVTGTDWHLAWQIGIPGGLLLVHLLIDQTWLSLHPFYRRRLTTAFSARRARLTDGDVVAHPYEFGEITSLSSYGKKHEGFPRVIFACAANLSGPDRTPPGRRAVSFTMSSDYLGGPDLGYVPTCLIETRAAGPLSSDITVQAAVAISGAAFASAMGAQARPIQKLLAISNARLGSWLPNPAYLDQLWRPDRDWWLPRLPSRRRLTYLLKEIFGFFPADDRLLYVTDGGHYDNLGLVELLRHRPETAFCIDASGDSPPFPRTLLEAITLARAELGIEITLEDPLDLLPGSADPLPAPLKKFSGRLSKVAVLKGTIKYPPQEGLPDSGTLIFGKALLTPDMPGELLGYAYSQPGFPKDGTNDQWFTQDQFDAYEELGRYIGKEARMLSSARRGCGANAGSWRRIGWRKAVTSFRRR